MFWPFDEELTMDPGDTQGIKEVGIQDFGEVVFKCDYW